MRTHDNIIGKDTDMKTTESNAEKTLVELYRQSYECEKLMKELYRDSYECAVKHLEASEKRVMELMAELQVQRKEYMKLLAELRERFGLTSEELHTDIYGTVAD